MAATETLLRKLQPLIPDRVAQWQHARPLADVDLRELIDREIHETARRLLGPYESRLLLSLPPQKLCRGEFDLGVVQYEQAKWQVGLRRGELLQNLAILGRSGAGKTNVVFHLLRQLLAKGVHVLFFDWKRTARHLLSSLPVCPAIYTPGRDIAPLTFNPFLPPPDEERTVYALQLVDTLGAAFTLGDGAKSVLTTALLDCYASDVEPIAVELLRRVQETKVTGRATGWQASAIRALQTLEVSLSQPGPNPPGTPVASLVNQSTIIELDALSDSAKAFLVPMLLLWIYRVQLAARRRERLQLVVVIEEAHHVLFRSERRTQESVMNRLLRQFREIGVGTIVVDQHPHLLSAAALGNAYGTICMNQKDPTDINKAAALSLLAEDEKPWLSRLPVGTGIVKLQDRWRQPILVKFPHVRLDKGAMSDADLRAYVRDSAGSAAKRHTVGGIGQVRRVLVSDSVLAPDELAFLSDVLAQPDDGVKARYRRMGVSAEVGTRLYRGLIERGLLESALIATGTTRTVHLRLSERGRQHLGLIEKSPTESLPHAYWKRFYAHHLRAAGYRVDIEAPVDGGSIDILAANENTRIAIEIETGRSDAVKNVRKCLAAGCDRVLLIATDENAMTIIEAQLARAGLLIAGRVQLSLRDAYAKS